MELKQYEVSQHGLSNIADDIGKIEEEKMKLENRELKESIEAQIKWMESEIAYTQKQLEEIQQRQLQIEYDYKEIKRNIIIFVSVLIGYDVLQNILAKGWRKLSKDRRK